MQLGYVVFEKEPSQYALVGTGEVAVPPKDPIGVIAQAAAELAKKVISSELAPTVELSLDHIYVYQV